MKNLKTFKLQEWPRKLNKLIMASKRSLLVKREAMRIMRQSIIT